MSSETRLADHRFLPGLRLACALPVSRYTRPSFVSTAGTTHGEAPPVAASAGFVQVRMNGSAVGSGVVNQRQSSVPSLALYASMWPCRGESPPLTEVRTTPSA